MIKSYYLSRLLARLALPLLAMFVAGAALADPPGRVGRLSLMEGTVSLHNNATGEWQAASLNWPIIGDDLLWTGPGDRAEVRVGSTVVRLDGSSELQVVQLDDVYFRVRLLRGSASVRLGNALQANRFEMSTEQGRSSGMQPGSYRFDVGDYATAVSVFSGITSFEGYGRLFVVGPGQRAEFTYSGQLDMYLTELRRDAFQDWIAFRDRREERLRDPRWISPEMTGYEDLDQYGDWQDSGEYGPLWTPRLVPIGWSPYRHGRWAMIGPWGWTWIDDAPWGFAPFHYGRWVYWRNTWAWSPGAYSANPTYAPALVAWIGQPGTTQLVLGTPGNVGWFPLGPREAYYPPYRASIGYVRQINANHVANVAVAITSTAAPAAVRFANRDRPNAVTVVSTAVVAASAPVAKAAVRNIDARAIAELPASTAVPVPAERRHRDADRDRRETDRDRRDTPRVAPSGPSVATPPAAPATPATPATPAPSPIVRPAPSFPRPAPVAPSVAPAPSPPAAGERRAPAQPAIGAPLPGTAATPPAILPGPAAVPAQPADRQRAIPSDALGRDAGRAPPKTVDVPPRETARPAIKDGEAERRRPPREATEAPRPVATPSPTPSGDGNAKPRRDAVPAAPVPRQADAPKDGPPRAERNEKAEKEKVDKVEPGDRERERERKKPPAAPEQR